MGYRHAVLDHVQVLLKLRASQQEQILNRGGRNGPYAMGDLSSSPTAKQTSRSERDLPVRLPRNGYCCWREREAAFAASQRQITMSPRMGVS